MKEILKLYLEEYSGKSRQDLQSYYDMVEECELRVPEELTHVHHIVPRCIYFGRDHCPELDSECNLIRVSIYDHIALHESLFLCTMDRKLFFAFNDTLLYNKEYFENPVKFEEYASKRKELFVLNMTSPEAMRKKTETNIRNHGSYMSPKCYTPEAILKRRETKIEKYGAPMAHRHTEEVRSRIAENHQGDPDWQLHTPESIMKMRKSKSKPVAKVDPETGRVIKVYWGVRECARQENFPEGTFKAKVRAQVLYKGYIWKQITRDEFSEISESNDYDT